MNHGPENDAHLLQRPRLDRMSYSGTDLYTVGDGFFILLCDIALSSLFAESSSYYPLPFYF